MAIVTGTTTAATGLMVLLLMMLMMMMVVMIGTFASTVAVGLWVTWVHIVVACGGNFGGGVEGSTRTASGPIANRCHNVQLPDRSCRLLIVNRANTADDRGRDLRFSITFCCYDCTMLLLLLLLMTVTLIITATRASLLGPGDQFPLLLLMLVAVVLAAAFRGILLA